MVTGKARSNHERHPPKAPTLLIQKPPITIFRLIIWGSDGGTSGGDADAGGAPEEGALVEAHVGIGAVLWEVQQRRLLLVTLATRSFPEGKS